MFHQKTKPTYIQEAHINMKKKVNWQRGTCQELRHKVGIFYPFGTTVFVLWQLGTTDTFEQWQLPGKREFSWSSAASLKAGFCKGSTWKCWETRMPQKQLFINSSPASGQQSSEDYMVPTGGEGTKPGLPVGNSPFMLLVQCPVWLYSP